MGCQGLKGFSRRHLFPNAKVQRCQISVTRNALAKSPKKLKKAIVDKLRSIFYASSRRKALQFFDQFKARWEKEPPSAIRRLENSFYSCLTFFKFPEEEQISLWATNIIECLNKESKRRTKAMGAVADEISFYILLGLICLKMELTRLDH